MICPEPCSWQVPPPAMLGQVRQPSGIALVIGARAHVRHTRCPPALAAAPRRRRWRRDRARAPSAWRAARARSAAGATACLPPSWSPSAAPLPAAPCNWGFPCSVLGDWTVWHAVHDVLTCSVLEMCIMLRWLAMVGCRHVHRILSGVSCLSPSSCGGCGRSRSLPCGR
jgi:hypothetical protein